jgi:S-DNA-T family DNA segregation ATPase FtsK/SpoIIIE
VNDPTVASGFGVRAPQIPDDLPGRLRIASSGLEAQVAMGAAGLAALPSRGSRETSLRDGDRPSSDDGGPQLIGVLAEHVPAMSLGAVPGSPAVGSLRLEVGVAADDLAVACLEVVTGDHVLVVGGPRSGVSTALRRCVDAMCSAMTRLGSPVRVIEVDRLHPVPDDVLDTAVASLVVIDDAHRVDDPGLLGEIIRGDHPHVTLMAGARADAVRTSYGHWTRELAKHRCGIVLTSRGDPDGDLLGVQLPRRSLVPVRPGLAWIVDGGSPRLVQVAVD